MIVTYCMCPHRLKRDCGVRGSLRPLPRSNVLGASDFPLGAPELGHGGTGFIDQVILLWEKGLERK